MHTMLGADKFRAGADLYFERHDGQAVTCEDFVRAMEDASGESLDHFRLWYAQAGTPRVKATLTQQGGRTRLALEQVVPPTPGQDVKLPMPIPLRMALFDAASGAKSHEALVILDAPTKEIGFETGGAPQILSINRGFSAPINLETNRTVADLAFLSAHDDDPFARYEAMQQLMLSTMLTGLDSGAADHAPVIEAVERTLEHPDLDAAFVGEAVLLPSEAFIGDHLAEVDPEAVHRAREALRRDLGVRLEPLWRRAYDGAAANRFELTPSAKGRRRLRTVSLNYILAAEAADAAALALHQYESADNMTDRQGALGALVNSDSAERAQALAAFYDRYRDNALVLDKWFTAQALSTRDDTVDEVARLAEHPDFTLANPNRLRSLVGAFAANQRGFHHASGRGYRFLADMIIAADKLNPQTAAKLVPPLGRWRRFDSGRQAQMRAELERIVTAPGVSKDVFEQASKSLA
jgi:aminopeptidase N